MRRYLRWILAVIAAITFLSRLISPALANTKEPGVWGYSEVWQPFTCSNGQKIVEDYTIVDEYNIFYDKEGNYFMGEQAVTQSGKIYLEDQPWKVIYYENEHWKTTLKPTGVFSQTGIIMKITIPHYGMIYHDIGRIVLTLDPVTGWATPVWWAGQHQFIDVENNAYDFTPACDYLTALP